jgi:outer membrane protein
MRLKAVFASLLSAVLLLQPIWGQDAPRTTPETAPAQQRMSQPDYSKGAPLWPHFTNVYKVPYVAEVNMGNSNRLESLLRDGNLYLSLDDAIALALENNLDIAYMRYQSLVADTDILRARAGFPIRNLINFGATSSLSTGSSATGGAGVNPLGSTTNASTITTFATGSTIAANGGVSVVGTNFIGGSAIPQLDPVFTTTVGWAHNSTPQSSTFITGTSTLITQGATTSMGYSQAFTTGTAFSLNFNTATNDSNSIHNVINP